MGNSHDKEAKGGNSHDKEAIGDNSCDKGAIKWTVVMIKGR